MQLRFKSSMHRKKTLSEALRLRSRRDDIILSFDGVVPTKGKIVHQHTLRLLTPSSKFPSPILHEPHFINLSPNILDYPIDRRDG